MTAACVSRKPRLGAKNIGRHRRRGNTLASAWRVGKKATAVRRCTSGVCLLQSDPVGLDGGINTYVYAANNPARFIDPFGLDETRWQNSDGGRNAFTDGPTNGNWGGKCLSGGMYSRDGITGGDAPPTDSGDRCYMHHDNCYEECGEFPGPKCIAACDARLVEELEDLPNDPRWWASPPREGTNGDSRSFRDEATKIFRRRLGTQ